MLSLSRIGAAALLIAALPREARAERLSEREVKEKRERHARFFEQVRVAVNGVMASGTSLVGAGSRGRYRRAGGALEFGVHRFVTNRLGFGLDFQAFPPSATGDSAKILFVRGEGFLDVGLASWGGALPGSVVAGAGLGGDGTRYWFSENGRFYAIAFGRLRLFVTGDTRVQLAYSVVPVALAAQHVGLHEHRFEVATGWKLLQVGTRWSYTFTRGGEPARDFFQQELGLFVGLSVY